MSEVEAQRRFRWIAMAFAAVAMVMAIVAVVVVMQRGDRDAKGDAAAGSAATPKKVALAPVSDAKVLATDIVKVEHGNVEVVVEAGESKGLRIKDAELVRVLGLEPGDVLVSLSGRPLLRDNDFHDAVFNISMMNATTLYVEVTRDGAPTLVRWKLDGDLRQARYGTSGSVFNSYGSYTPSTPPPRGAPDPVLVTNQRVDDTHATLPRKTADRILADLAVTSKGARIVPSMKNGQPNGMKLYAIRPSSVFARLNFSNGDTVHAINGHDLSSASKLLEVYSKLKGVSELTFDVTRRGKPVTLVVTITK